MITVTRAGRGRSVCSVAIVAALLGAGCTGPRAKVNGTLLVAAGAMAFLSGAAATTGPSEDSDAGVVGSVVVTTGLVLVPLGFVTFIAGAASPEETRAVAEPIVEAVVEPPASVARREALARAWALTQEAARAARAGDCGVVRTNDARVREQDVSFYAVVFSRDAAIARCMMPVTPRSELPEDVLP